MLLIGIFICILASIIPFIDCVSIIFSFTKLKPKDYDNYLSRINSLQYKEHKKKWRRIYLVLSLIFVVLYFLIWMFLQNILKSFYGAIICYSIIYGIVNNSEYKTRRRIEAKKSNN